MTQLSLDGPRLERRGGHGPIQPIWDDCSVYSAEWYRRFRDWTLTTYPDVDQGTRDNLNMLVSIASDE